MTRLRPTSKAGVVLLALLGAGILLASGSRVWVTGTVDDAVLGASRVSGTGTQVASGVIALALAAAAAAIATTTSGPVVRRVTLVVLLLAAAAEAFFAARVLLDPSGVLGSVAAASTGRTGTIETNATVTAWPWIALAAVVPLLVAGVGGWVGSRSWRGLGARYETPGADSAGPRGQRVASDWDRLDAGEDPTVRDDGRTT
ncbi:MAG TPA: Trp biosynthesis-associated membrane protein [Pedococcus sp.]|uniref:Trp biosynthesis-associated membrane protein n=1 Tax=Pedococcus sp. TaxID=2860345 RepID=UPI002F92CD38